MISSFHLSEMIKRDKRLAPCQSHCMVRANDLIPHCLSKINYTCQCLILKLVAPVLSDGRFDIDKIIWICDLQVTQEGFK